MKTEKTDLSVIGDNIRRLLFDRKISNRAFAKQTGISEQLISRYTHRGVSDVRILAKIADALGVGIEELITEK